MTISFGSLDRIMKIKFLIVIFLLLILNFCPLKIYADTPTDSAISYLKAQQVATGQITGGSTGDASSWAAIAFSANGTDPSTIKNTTNSLMDYLQNNPPTTTSAATE